MEPRLIGFAGERYSGKDTAASALPGYDVLKFATALKLMMRSLLIYVGLPDSMADRCLHDDLKEHSLPELMGHDTRHGMQTLGSEWGREHMHEDFWLHVLDMRRKVSFQKGHSVAITDVRFPNEVDFVHKHGGKVILLERPIKLPPECVSVPHASENMSLIRDKVDLVLINEFTLPVFLKQVQDAVEGLFA